MQHFRRMSLGAIQLISILMLSGVPYIFWMGQGYALELSTRSITLSISTPSAVSTHAFKMTINSSSAIGSIVFQYCSNSPLIFVACVAPAGMSATGAVLSQQAGNTGFNIDAADSNANTLIISRPASLPARVPSSYTFTGVTNPSVISQTTFVRISTYASTDGTGSYIDNGTVAFSTQSNYTIGAFIPPFLTLCVGVTVAPDCSQQTGENLDFGVLSGQTTKNVTSQIAASTNEVTGYNLYVMGTTMTSGNNIIPALTSPTGPQLGVSEFGLNLRGNSNPSVGADPSGNGTAIPTNSYNSPNQFNFISGDEIASSSVSTDFNRLTASYIVDVSNAQPPGVYSTTLIYLASANF